MKHGLRNDRGHFAPRGEPVLSLECLIDFELPEVQDAVDEAEYRNLGHAAASIRKEMIASIDRDPKPSAPGEPPNTRKGQLRRAIRFDVVKEGYDATGAGIVVDAVVGPLESIVGESAAAHEFGEVYKGQVFEDRPFAAPALDKNLNRFADLWSGSIGS